MFVSVCYSRHTGRNPRRDVSTSEDRHRLGTEESRVGASQSRQITRVVVGIRNHGNIVL